MRSLSAWFSGLVIACLGCASAANAANINAIQGNDGGRAIITVEGPFAPGDAQKFANLALAHSSAVVLLNSDGGQLMAGLEIGRAIRLKGFATVVPDGFQCASACALAWLAGTPRFLGPKGRIGFHAAYLEENGQRMPTATGNALVGAYLNQLGLPATAVIYITSAPPEGMRWLDLSDAATTGIEARKFELSPPSVASSSASTPQSAPPAPSAAPTGLDARPVPSPPGRFSDFPAGAPFVGPKSAPVLDAPGKNAYRTRLRAAAKEAPTFAARFAVAEWGCGTSCLTGALVDLQSGEVSFFPGTFSGWGMVDPKFRAAEYRLGSSLIVFSGQVNEQGPIGSHYYNFSDRRFRYLGSVLTSNDFKTQLGTRWLPELAGDDQTQKPASSSGDTLTGRISEFICGDNCYLTIVDDFGKKHDGLCVATTCQPWNRSTSIPKGLIGRQVSVKVGMGVQIDSSGEQQGRMLSFREITLYPAGGATQP